MKHLVQFSTGLSSAEVAWRLVAEHGPEAVVLMSADTLREHPDNWRFGQEVANRLGCEWLKLTDGRTPMQAGLDVRCVPNNAMAVCSKILKRELLRAYLDEHYDPERDVVYIGYDWSEPHRLESAQKFWAPWTMKAPLAEPPYATPLQPLFRACGIEPPELYKYNLAHANCGGMCVCGGQAQWAAGLERDRDAYLSWECEEEKARAVLGKDVAILRDRRKSVIAKYGKAQPISLRSFRLSIERKIPMFGDDPYDPDDWGACGCDMDGDTAPQDARKRVPKVERWGGSGWVPVITEAAA